MLLMETPHTPRMDPALDVAARLGRVAEVGRLVRGATSVADLFARASDGACTACGFSRGLVVTLEDGLLSSDATGPCTNTASDRLRRVLLAQPVPLRRGSMEHAAFRLGNGFRRERQTAPSALAEALGLTHSVMTPVVAEARAVALLVLDRPTGEPDAADLAAVQLVADIVAHELAVVVQRARVDVLVDEVRQSSAALLALAREALSGPVVLPRDHGLGPTFPRMDVPSSVPADTAVQRLLSPGELKVVGLLAEGRSNREIAESLTLSPETVKTYVARILRKLGAANRAEAVSLYLKLTARE